MPWCHYPYTAIIIIINIREFVNDAFTAPTHCQYTVILYILSNYQPSISITTVASFFYSYIV